jgi:small subunit ribosomal protein S13
MYANAVLTVAEIEKNKQAGTLTDEEIKRLEEIIKNPANHGIPAWLFDRRKSPETGEDTHIVTNDLVFLNDQDIKNLKKVKSYRGVRHMFRLPSRGQKTRSNFRRNKGKVMGVRVSSKKSGTT